MDRRPSLLYSALALIVLLWALNWLAVTFYFYWIYWWYDVLMHFLGGIAEGLAAYWVLFHSGIFFHGRFKSEVASVLSVLLCVMVVATAWEYFEYIFNITDSHEGYYFDTFNDLVLGASGAVIAGLIGLGRKKI